MKRKYALESIKDLVADEAWRESIVDKLIKDGIIEENFGNQAVSGVVEAFKDSFGTTKASKWDRFSAKRLSDKYGSDSIVKVIKALASSQDKYRPTVNSVQQLEDKWVQVGTFLRSKSVSKQEVIEL